MLIVMKGERERGRERSSTNEDNTGQTNACQSKEEKQKTAGGGGWRRGGGEEGGEGQRAATTVATMTMTVHTKREAKKRGGRRSLPLPPLSLLPPSSPPLKTGRLVEDARVWAGVDTLQEASHGRRELIRAQP